MARNRQRSKQRQQERRDARLAERGEPAGQAEASARPRATRQDAPETDGVERERIEREREHEELEREEREADLLAGAPPQELGTSEDTLQHGPHLDEDDAVLDEAYDNEDFDFEDEEQPADGSGPPARGPRGVRGDGSGARPGEPTHRGRGRLIAFLIAVWAELKRVQWPDRKQLTQMTSIVLVFVLIAGGYLGLLDAIFSRIIKAIL